MRWPASHEARSSETPSSGVDALDTANGPAAQLDGSDGGPRSLGGSSVGQGNPAHGPVAVDSVRLIRSAAGRPIR